MTFASLREQLVGRRVVELRGSDGVAGPELSEIVLEDGVVLRLNWFVASSGEYGGVGFRVGRAQPEPTRRVTGVRAE